MLAEHLVSLFRHPPMHSRPYDQRDRAECLQLFASNTPTFFLPAELPEFERFLDRLPGPYFVLVENGAVIACGGYATGRVDREADICWTIVRRDQHGRGAGGMLIQTCLDGIAARTNCNRVRLETSQHTCAFFSRFGFEAVEITPDGFGPNLDRIEMRMTL